MKDLNLLKLNSQPTAIDLFCGPGGLTVGLKQAGFRVIGAVDDNELAVETYKTNHRIPIVWRRDIRKLSVAEVKRVLDLSPGQLDLLAGCPPCQGFSRLATLNGSYNIRDERNNLILEFSRFVRGLKPKTIMLENVPVLSSHRLFKQFCKQLNELGYTVNYDILNVQYYGVPQRRRRLILIAARKGIIEFAKPNDDMVTVRDAIGNLPRPGKSGDPLHDCLVEYSDKVKKLIKRIPKDGGSRKALGCDQLACHQRLSGFGDVYGRMSWNHVAPTITSGCYTPSKGRYLHPRQNRVITLREAALLQSFSPKYYFSLKRGKGPAAVMIGNALPPNFIKEHARKIRKFISNNYTF